MHFPFLHPVGHQYFPSENPQLVIHEQPTNTSEGSEFLDDAIRMEDIVLNNEQDNSNEII